MSRVFGGCRALMAAAKAAAKGAAAESPNPRRSAAAAAKEKTATTRSTGILKVVPVSPAMRSFLGVPEISRTEAIKKIWEYIKLNDLQVGSSSFHLGFTVLVLFPCFERWVVF